MSLRSVLGPILPQRLKTAYNIARCRTSVFISRLRYSISGIEIIDYKSIPIIINNFNRLESLQKLIVSLENRGYHNIYIIDNDSQYPPLLEFYDSCKYRVFRLRKNVGYMSIWKTHIYDMFKKSWYVYTDSDVVLDEDCPDDFMAKFVGILNKYKHAQKVGFALRIDDLPDCFKNKSSVIQHEQKFWSTLVEKGLYRAPIDTTFALYRPFCGGPADDYQITYRTGFPYVIKHLPWYTDSDNLSQEEQYYIKNVIKSTHWSKQA